MYDTSFIYSSVQVRGISNIRILLLLKTRFNKDLSLGGGAKYSPHRVLPGPQKAPWPHPAQVQRAAQTVVHVASPTACGYGGAVDMEVLPGTACPVLVHSSKAC